MATKLGDAAVGTTVKIKESNTPVDYIIVHQGLPSTLYDESCNGTWVLRKECYNQMKLYDKYASSTAISYPGSLVNTYLENTFINVIHNNIREKIQLVKLPFYEPYGKKVYSGEEGMTCHVFILGGKELGIGGAIDPTFTSYYPPNDGVKLSYFLDGNQYAANQKRISIYDNAQATFWTRSVRTAGNSKFFTCSGDFSYEDQSQTEAVRPAFILPPDLYISDSGEVVTNSPPTAPDSLTVPTVTAGDPVAISWTAATDPDGTITAYHLERSANMGVWEEIYSGPALTYTDTIGADWGTVAYRVCAEDNQGALGPYATSEVQEVQAGVLYLSGPTTALGMLTGVTTFRIKVGVSGHTEIIPDISMTLELDGATLFEGVVVTGYDLTFPLDPRILGGGAHTITGKAEKQGYVTANQTYTFYTAVLKFPDGGLGTLMQDEQGRSVFPQTSAALVQGLKNQSVGANLEELYAATGLLLGASFNEMIITFAPEFEGQTFTVTDGTDTITGTVSEGLVESVRLKNNNSVYTVSATASNGNEYAVSVSTGAYYGQYLASLAVFDATARVTAAPGAVVTATKTENGNAYTATAGSDGVAVVPINQTGAYTLRAVKDGAASDTAQLEVTEEQEYTAALHFIVLTVQSVVGSDLTLTDGTTTLQVESTTGTEVFYLPNTGTWTGTIAKDGETASGSVNCSAYQNYTLELSFVKIYGASWDGTSTTKWTRTDDAAGFVDPVPYVAGASSYSSPFDNRLPWSGMVKTERTGGTMVTIPKFWYKLTQNGAGMQVQIADKASAGFAVSPAHMNRGDGKGERDVVYVGRHHCGAAAYKSVTGQMPKNNITRAAARTAVHNLGANIWQSDFAMRFTLWLLYIVEFADWNSQKTIGAGCGNNSGVQAMGYTDSMPYHTGTTQSSRDTYGLGIQYRNIEGLWDNLLDWCDGCYNNNNGLNIILNPNNFSDSANGISIGTPSSGWPSAFGVKSVSGTFPTFIPTAASGSEITYSCDHWLFNPAYPCVCVGGDYIHANNFGLFYIISVSVSYNEGGIGIRLMELP